MDKKQTREQVIDKDLRKFTCPSQPIQQKFGSIAKEVETMIGQQKHSKWQIDNLFNDLMQKVFKRGLA